MSYNIAVCDDSTTDREYVIGFVQQWSAKNGHKVNISSFPSAENFLFLYEEKNNYDILLLDIELGAMDGVELAKRLRKTNDTVQIVFITGYSDYIAEEYEVAALHYLMKPVKEDKKRIISGDLNSVVNTLKELSTEIKDAGFDIETEDYDFEDLYQIIIKIEK